MLKHILVFLIVILCSFAVSAECAAPVDGDSLSGTILLCEGSYHLEKGLTLTGDESVLDCNNAVFTGGDKAVIITGNKAVLQYCSFDGFEKAVDVQAKNVQLRHLVFTNNVVAVDYSKGSVSLKDISAENQVISNESSVLALPVEVKPAKPVEISAPKVSADVVKNTEFDSVFAGVSLIHVFALGLVGLAVLSYFASETKRVLKHMFNR